MSIIPYDNSMCVLNLWENIWLEQHTILKLLVFRHIKFTAFADIYETIRKPKATNMRRL